MYFNCLLCKDIISVDAKIIQEKTPKLAACVSVSSTYDLFCEKYLKNFVEADYEVTMKAQEFNNESI